MAQSISRIARQGVPLAAMLDSWVLALEGENKSRHTIRSYSDTVRALIRFAGDAADTDITTEQLRAFLAAELARPGRGGRTMSPASVAVHYRNLRVFFGWLAAEEPSLVPASPMDRVGKVEVPAKRKPPFSAEEQKALLAAVSGSGFADRRDAAIIRAFIDTGLRVSGMAGLAYFPGEPERSDVHLGQRVLDVRLKGGAVTAVPVGRKTCAAIDRYLRARARHQHAESGWLWVGPRGRLTVWGIRQMLERRARQAGIEGMHPHRFRRTFAHDWLEAGGTESDLMNITGWRTRDMIEVYASELALDRARSAHARLSPGDRL